MPDRSIFGVGPDDVQDNKISSNFLDSPRFTQIALIMFPLLPILLDNKLW
jgi:hypothetical protein